MRSVRRTALLGLVGFGAYSYVAWAQLFVERARHQLAADYEAMRLNPKFYRDLHKEVFMSTQMLRGREEDAKKGFPPIRSELMKWA